MNIHPRTLHQVDSVTRGDATILEMSTGISLSTNPVLEFLHRPGVDSGKPIKVRVIDTAGKS